MAPMPWKPVWSFLKKISIEITYNQTVLLLGILLQRTETMVTEKLAHDCL